MTIQEMLEREDIYAIIEKTLPFYYSNAYGKKVHVKIEKKRAFKKLLIYPRLGIIIPRFPSRKVIKEVFAWFDVQNNIIKKIIAKLYIYLCLLSGGLLAHRSLYISDSSLYNNNTLIIPGNRKIRIYYFDKMVVDSVIKDGFNDTYFKKEIKIRENLKYPFIVPISQKGNRWYRERLLVGHSLVRIPQKEYDKYLGDVLISLTKIHHDCYRKMSINNYCNELVLNCYTILEKVITHKKISCGDALKKVISFCDEKTKKAYDMIPIVFSHGDLQNGNIHIDQESNKTYIIDWETGGLKSVWYDAATLLCFTRRKNRFSYMINHINDLDVKNKILIFDSNHDRDMKTVASVLLLEELLFFLDEMMGYPLDIGSEVINRYLYELDRIEWGLLE